MTGEEFRRGYIGEVDDYERGLRGEEMLGWLVAEVRESKGN